MNVARPVLTETYCEYSKGSILNCISNTVQLKAKYNISALEEFPGKHWFSSLSHEQLLARRIGLERYLHSVCQDRTIGTSDMLKEFFIAMQRVSEGWRVVGGGGLVSLSGSL